MQRPNFLVAFVLGTIFGGCALGAATAVARPERDPLVFVEELAHVLVRVENGYVDPVDRAKLLEGSIKGMVAELDPHSGYLPADELRRVLEETEGQFGGVGVEVETRGDAIIVIAPIEGAPAERAGIRSGDRIVGVNGERIEGSSYESLVKHMRGLPGTKVVLTVVREGAKDVLHFELTRAVVSVSSVEWAELDEGVGYLRVKQFQDLTAAEFARAVVSLRKSGKVKTFLLDLRYNPGGLVDAAAAVADEMLDSGTIYSTRHRGMIESEVHANTGGGLTKEPLIVLVNEWSASAAELLAGALQDNGRAKVYGANTFGKGSVQTILELPGGAGLKLTTARYFTPSGRAIQAAGVTPDVAIATKTPWPLIKERDLEGYLPAVPGERAVVSAAIEPTAIGDASVPRVLRAKELPRDPRKGEDETLRAAFEALVKK